MTGYDLKDIGFRKFPWRKPVVSAMETDGFLHDNQWSPLRQPLVPAKENNVFRQREQPFLPLRQSLEPWSWTAKTGRFQPSKYVAKAISLWSHRNCEVISVC